MTYFFDPNDPFIAVDAVLVGPRAFYDVVMALDTGATQTIVDQDVLSYLGVDLSQPIAQFSITTVNGMVPVKEYRIDSLTALGIDMRPTDVIARVVQGDGYEGLLGKDFFRGRVLKIDFVNGTIEVT